MDLYVQEIMHIVAQALLVPVMVALVLLLVFTLWSIGSLLMEIFAERRYFKVNMPESINAIHDASYQDVEQVVIQAALLNPQKKALIMVANNMGLPDDDLFSLARTEIAKVDGHNQRTVNRTDLVTKVAPMMGLMCTLIPLGPGIVAMGLGDVNQLSTSLLIAFDGTVAGLVAAVVAMVISSIRKRWYAQYLLALESLMSCILEKAAEAHKAGIELPHNYTGAPEKYAQARPSEAVHDAT
jgi:biopolymer transport protein ExbB/TolQ